MRQGVPLLFVAMLAAGAIGRVSSGPSEPERPAATVSRPPAELATQGDRCPGPRGRIDAFLTTRGDRSRTADARLSASVRARGLAGEVRLTAPPPVEERPDAMPAQTLDHVVALIATVPDPLASRLDYEFDLVVSAIQTAAEAETYSFATSWLPWSARDGDDEGRDAVLECARNHPGVLIFRTETYVLLVFLVGETPTAGVHPAALEEAIALADEWGQKDKDKWRQNTDGVHRPVHVLGPTYSGSAVSLSRVLHRTGLSFRVISGSARLDFVDGLFTAATPGRALQRAAAPAPAEPNGEALPVEPPAFERTIHTQRVLGIVAEEHLCGLGIPRGKITYLAESSTLPGVTGPTGARVARKGDLTAPEASRWCSSIASRPEGEGANDSPTVIKFPFHISDVRRALERERARPGRAQIAGYELPSSLLGLRQDRSDRRGDLLPAFSENVSNYDELALAMQITSACEARSKAFGIVATDVRDKRFLIERVRSLCPTALVFTFESDLLFAYPDEQSQLGGTLVFSSYPLFPEVSAQDRQHSLAVLLGDSPAIGIHNAAVVHLLELYQAYLPSDPDRKDYVAKNAWKLVDYRSPGVDSKGPEHPPVWISVAGRNAMLPIAVVEPEAQSRSLYATPSVPRLPGGAPPAADHPRKDRRGHTQGLAVWIVKIALAMYGVWIAVRWWPRQGASRGGWTAAHLGFAALAILAIIILTSAPPPPWNGSVTWILLALLRLGTRAAAAFTLLGTVAALVALARPDSPLACSRQGQSRRVPDWFAAAAAAIVLGVAIDRGANAMYHHIASDQILFLTVRMMHLSSGVSPLVPLLCLAVAAHLVLDLQLRRASLLEARFPGPGAFAPLLGGVSSTVGWADEQLRWLLCRGWRAWRLPLVAVTVVAAVGMLVAVLRWTPTVEGPWFDGAVRIGFVTIALVVAERGARAALAWHALRVILRRTARHPLRHALQALPRFTPQERFGNLLSMRPTVRELEISEALLARCAPPVWTLKDGRRREELIDAEIRRVTVGPIGDRRGPWCEGAFGEHQRIAEQLAASAAVQERWRTQDLEVKAPSAEELFVARQFTLAVAWVATHVRELLSATVPGAILVAMAIGAYPFPATRVLVLAVWVLLLAAAFTAIWIVYSFERTEVAAWMAGARPGSAFDWKLAGRVVALCVLPVVVVIALQFPDAANWLARTLDPLLASVK